MKILFIDTSGTKAKIGLISEEKSYFNEFLAKNRLSDFLLVKIEKLLENRKNSLNNLGAIALFLGPGSFTGLRIGVSVANTLGFSKNIPIIEVTENDKKNLAKNIINKFKKKKFKKMVIPFYGREPRITKPKERK